MSNFDECMRLLQNKFFSDDMRNLPMAQVWHLIGHFASEKFAYYMEHDKSGYEPIGIRMEDR